MAAISSRPSGVKQREQQMLGFDGLMIVLVGEGLCRLHRFLRLQRELVEPHLAFSALSFLNCRKSSFSCALSWVGTFTWILTY